MALHVLKLACVNFQCLLLVAVIGENYTKWVVVVVGGWVWGGMGGYGGESGDEKLI